MIELKRDFTKKGVKYHQVWKDSNLIIYRCERTDANDVYWEVFKPKTHMADRYHNDEYEVYPSDESFGAWAWCCSSKKSIAKILNKHFSQNDCMLTNEEIADFAVQ